MFSLLKFCISYNIKKLTKNTFLFNSTFTLLVYFLVPINHLKANVFAMCQTIPTICPDPTASLSNPVAAPLITLRPACFRPRRACKVN
ncbi:hypothetical protein BpHYR1_047412 [Brachionus plicatilis]|uniref:Uncharacterized protein n=1 Tax=Brachionus plicatilis TaxID=10195 RepID=A0A3M7PS71_BRAPC|nr:hypothetical protein BpHYR1_047412 [Brachionus plicatilis]